MTTPDSLYGTAANVHSSASLSLFPPPCPFLDFQYPDCVALDVLPTTLYWITKELYDAILSAILWHRVCLAALRSKRKLKGLDTDEARDDNWPILDYNKLLICIKASMSSSRSSTTPCLLFPSSFNPTTVCVLFPMPNPDGFNGRDNGNRTSFIVPFIFVSNCCA